MCRWRGSFHTGVHTINRVKACEVALEFFTPAENLEEILHAITGRKLYFLNIDDFSIGRQVSSAILLSVDGLQKSKERIFTA